MTTGTDLRAPPQVRDLDRREWAHHPVTVEFLRSLRETRQDTMESWALEKFGSELENACALGGIRVVDQAIALIEGYAALADSEQQIERVNT